MKQEPNLTNIYSCLIQYVRQHLCLEVMKPTSPDISNICMSSCLSVEGSIQDHILSLMHYNRCASLSNCYNNYVKWATTKSNHIRKGVDIRKGRELKPFLQSACHKISSNNDYKIISFANKIRLSFAFTINSKIKTHMHAHTNSESPSPTLMSSVMLIPICTVATYSKMSFKI